MVVLETQEGALRCCQLAMLTWKHKCMCELYDACDVNTETGVHVCVCNSPFTLGFWIEPDQIGSIQLEV